MWIVEVLFEQFLIRTAVCNGLNLADNEYLTFQMIIDIAWACGVISDAVCVGSPFIIKRQ